MLIPSSAACNPLAGKVFQSYSPKWAYLVYIVIFMIGSLVSAVAPSSGAVIGGRVIMGIGASGMLGGILAIIGLFISKKDQPCELPPSQVEFRALTLRKHISD